MHLLIVRDVYAPNDAGNLGAERGEVAANVSVVGNLFRFAAFPGIPVPGNGNQDRESEQYNQDRRDVSLPTRGRLSCALLFARQFRLRCGAGDSTGTGEADINYAPFSASDMARAEFSFVHPKATTIPTQIRICT